MIKKKLQVFVSSTYTDLKEERQAAVEAILDAGHIPAGMELFKAGKSQMNTIHKWIDESDIFMLILGGRYGSIEEESGLSYTELEYRYALSKNMPVFTILLNESLLSMKAVSMGQAAIFEKDNVEKYDLFKKFVSNIIVRFADNKDQISSIVKSQLDEFMNDSELSLVGWVKSDKIIDLFDGNLDLEELKTLKDKINQGICNCLFHEQYRNYAIDFSNTFDDMLINNLMQQTFIDRFSRQVIINVNGDEAYITMKTQISYINVKNNTFYRSSPIFPTEEQANSYEHLEFRIDNIDYTNKVNKKIIINENNRQMRYLVKNQYPIDRSSGNVVIFHKVKYKIDINNFYQLYLVSYPCRDFDVSILIEGKDKEKYRLILGTNEYFIRDSYSEKTQFRDKQTCIIRLPHWILSGSGYNFTVQKEYI